MDSKDKNLAELNLIRKINTYSATYYSSTSLNKEAYQHDAYLTECNKALFEYFQKTLESRLLFSALTYINHSSNKEKVRVVKGLDKQTSYNFHERNIKEIDALKNELNIALEKVKNGKLLSMTHVLLDKKNQHDLFLVAKARDYEKVIDIANEHSKILTASLGDCNFQNEIKDFYLSNETIISRLLQALRTNSSDDGIQSNQIAEYLWHFKKIEAAYQIHNPKKSFYVHFIRPSIIDVKYDYNLLLSLATNETLNATELALVDLFVFRIVSQMFLEKVKDEEKQNLAILRAGMGHFLKHRIAGKESIIHEIQRNIHQETTADREFIDLKKGDACRTIDTGLINRNSLLLLKNMKHIGNIGMLFHIISQASKLSKVNVFETSKAKSEWLQPDPIPLEELLRKLIEDNYDGGSNVNYNADLNSFRHYTIVPFLSVNAGSLPKEDIYLELLYELLLNASKYTPKNKNNFDISITVEHNDEKFYLIVGNRVHKDFVVRLKPPQSRYKNCQGTWGKLENDNTTELSGVTFVDEFLQQTKLGEMEIKINDQTSYTEFLVRIHFKGLINNQN